MTPEPQFRYFTDGQSEWKADTPDAGSGGLSEESNKAHNEICARVSKLSDDERGRYLAYALAVATPGAGGAGDSPLHPVLPEGFAIAGQLKHYPYGEILHGCIWRPGDAAWSRETSWSGMGGVTDSFGEWWFAKRIAQPTEPGESRTPAFMWNRCPECGSPHHNHFHGYEETHRQCVNCGQEWHTDLDYLKLARMDRAAARAEASRVEILEAAYRDTKAIAEKALADAKDARAEVEKPREPYGRTIGKLSHRITELEQTAASLQAENARLKTLAESNGKLAHDEAILSAGLRARLAIIHADAAAINIDLLGPGAADALTNIRRYAALSPAGGGEGEG